MTRAPTNLQAVRSLLLAHLNVDKKAVRDQDLEPAEVGIVGDSAHRGGYHCGSDRVVSNDYSVVESSRDRSGLTLDAAALDVGQFKVAVAGRNHDLRSFSTWCVAQCQANAADTRDIREIIYSPDGKTVRRWDRLGRRTSGDSSHLWHTHFSFFRDAIKAGRDQTPLFRRYLTTIGLLEDDMSADAERKINELHAAMLGKGPSSYPASVVQMIKDVAWVLVKGPEASGAWAGKTLARIAEAAGISPAELEQIAAAARAGAADAATTALAQLTPEKVAQAVVDAMPADQAKQVAEELAARLAA
ncbi:hypothetical protein ACIBTV_27185 [Micromonospora sp. NPDC049366]|uniref:hypothetical protein n=1 Tax=Micromonospora sp. NPDC049366 TaxID=3364271 RepID=UPI0037A09DBA